MMGERTVMQEALFYSFSLEDHVPADHLLRSIDRFVDLGDIREHLRPHYSEMGRPSIDPELLIRMLIVGYCFGIRSERRLCEEVHLNLAYRWFLGLGIDEKVPDHSTISQAYRRRFQGNDVFQQIFEDIVRQAESHGLVSGRILITDSTHIRANANKKKFDKVEVERVVGAIEDELLTRVNEERAERGKKN